MTNTNRCYLFQKATTITLSPMSNSECFEPRIPREIETRKKKGKNTNSNDDRTRWRKFTNSRCRFDRFSRMDSATSSISYDHNYVSPCNEEGRISFNSKTPALVMNEVSMSERSYRREHQVTATKIDFQSKQEFRVSKE
jgi:hypothetical protein